MLRALAFALVALVAWAPRPSLAAPRGWSEHEARVLASLRRRGTPPPSPSNRVADDPRAAALGRRIFFDTGFSASGAASCGTCHLPARHFTDGSARSVVAPAGRNAPTVVGAAYGSWFYWDGRRDSLWAQALVPFEATSEIAGSRIGVVRRIATDARYRAAYEEIFGPLPSLAATPPAPSLPERAGPLGDEAARKAWFRIPQATRDALDRAFANVGKAVEAYERTLLPEDSRFDRYVDAIRAGREREAESLLSREEVAGLRLFIDPARTQCMQCHNGPQFTNGGFHNIGTGSFRGDTLDFGRALGLRAVLLDVFNCLGPHSDAGPNDCAELRFLGRDDHVPLEGSFKTPSLRDIEKTAPYLHDGRFATLGEVLTFYNLPPPEGGHELRPLGLSAAELGALEAFLRALASERRAGEVSWSDTERALLASLQYGTLPPPPSDAGNRAGDDPKAAALGAALFSDARLSGNGALSCASCHQPARAYSDGRPRGIGLAPLHRNTPSLRDVAFERWLYRDGRADSLWSQALVPIEHPAEMGGNRTAAARHVATDPLLRELFAAAFGPVPALDWSSLPGAASPRGNAAERAAWAALGEPARNSVDRVFSAIGKAIAAFERTLRAKPSRFDAYVAAVLAGRDDEAARQLDASEVAGLRVFISGRAGCLACHVGPRFSDGRFHNIGTADLGTPGEDLGREAGLASLRDFEFRCGNANSDTREDKCEHLTQMRESEVPELLRGAFKTPSLRGLSTSAPYLHDGRFSSLEELLDFYRRPPNKAASRHELPATLALSDGELTDLARFLRALEAE